MVTKTIRAVEKLEQHMPAGHPITIEGANIFESLMMELMAPDDNVVNSTKYALCMDADGRKEIAREHLLLGGKTDYDAFILEYKNRNSGLAPAVVVSWAIIEPILAQYNIVKFETDDISGGLRYMGDMNEFDPVLSDFSTCHLRGIHERDNNNNYAFTMAYDTTHNCETVVIWSGSNYYDFSNNHP